MDFAQNSRFATICSVQDDIGQGLDVGLKAQGVFTVRQIVEDGWVFAGFGGCSLISPFAVV